MAIADGLQETYDFRWVAQFRRKDDWAYQAYLICCLVQGVGIEYSFWFVRFDDDDQFWLCVNLTGTELGRREIINDEGRTVGRNVSKRLQDNSQSSRKSIGAYAAWRSEVGGRLSILSSDLEHGRAVTGWEKSSTLRQDQSSPFLEEMTYQTDSGRGSFPRISVPLA